MKAPRRLLTGGTPSTQIDIEDIVALLDGSATPDQDMRVRKAFRNPSGPLRSWVAALSEHGRTLWRDHHSAHWSKLQALLMALEEEGKLTHTQYRELIDLHPEIQKADRGQDWPMSDDEIAELAESAVERLRTLLPNEAPRIEQMLAESFELRANRHRRKRLDSSPRR